MKVEVETISSYRKSLKIEIPADEVNSELEKSYEEAKKSVQVPGFRKGKAPKSILKARFGDYLKAEALQNLIPSAYEKAVQDESLEPLGEVEFKPDLSEIKIKENEPITFEVVFDVKPKLEIPNFELIEVNKQSVDVPKESVEKYVEQIREEKADYLPIEDDRPAQNGDSAKAHIDALVDGETGESEGSEEVMIDLGSRKHLAEIEDGIIGMKPGETKEIPVFLPENYDNPQLAGKNVLFRVSLIAITQKKLPELDDEFAKDLGYDSYSQFFSRTWNMLIETEKQLLRGRQVNEATVQLLEKCQFEIPEALIESQIKHMIDEISLQMRREGTSFEEEVISPEQLKNDLRNDAIDQVKRAWILDEIVSNEEIDVEEDEIDAAIEEIAKAQNRDPQKYLELFKASPKRLEELTLRLRNGKIFDLIIEKASAKRAIIA